MNLRSESTARCGMDFFGNHRFEWWNTASYIKVLYLNHLLQHPRTISGGAVTKTKRRSPTRLINANWMIIYVIEGENQTIKFRYGGENYKDAIIFQV